MKFNKDTAISTDQILLVPYDKHHVVTYHQWMEDPAIQEATASEPLTLEEEYENQQSWRDSHDKLTFILCQPTKAEEGKVNAGQCDSPDRMIGDINFFLYPWDDDADEKQQTINPEKAQYVGEIDVMVADTSQRGKGIGKAAVDAFMHYICCNLHPILQEHHGVTGKPRLRKFMVKIKADNRASIALFKGVGFKQDGDVDYFGEIKMVLDDFGSFATKVVPEFRELIYCRPSAQGKSTQ